MKKTTFMHGEPALAPTLFPAGVLAHGLPDNAQNSAQHAMPSLAADGSSTHVRFKFSENDRVEIPSGFSTRETWSAAVWLNGLAAEGGHIEDRLINLPAADPDAVRRWFYHRWQGVRENTEPRWVAGALAGIGSLARVHWDEVAAHYRRCPWADVIQDAFSAAREAGLPVDRSARTVGRRRDAIAFFLDRPVSTCRELTREEWLDVGAAIRTHDLVW